MNKSLIIVPSVMVVAFVAFERPAQRRLDAATQAHLEQVARDRAAEAGRREDLQQIAKIEANRRNAEREEQERLKAEAKQHAYETAVRGVEVQTSAHLAACDQLSTELASLDLQVADARARSEAADRTSFDLAKRVEAQRTHRHNFDLEIQRTTAMVTRRFYESPWAETLGVAPPPGPSTP